MASADDGKDVCLNEPYHSNRRALFTLLVTVLCAIWVNSSSHNIVQTTMKTIERKLLVFGGVHKQKRHLRLTFKSSLLFLTFPHLCPAMFVSCKWWTCCLVRTQVRFGLDENISRGCVEPNAKGDAKGRGRERPWRRPGGHLGIFWVGMCRPGLQIGTPL